MLLRLLWLDNKIGYVHIIENSTSAIWIELTNIMLNNGSQTQNSTEGMFPIM